MGSVVGHVTGHVMANANTPPRAANSRSSSTSWKVLYTKFQSLVKNHQNIKNLIENKKTASEKRMQQIISMSAQIRLTARTRIFRPGPVPSRRGTGMGWDQPGTGAPGPGLAWDRDRDGIRSLWDGMGQDRTFMGWDGTGIPACPGQHVTKERYQCCKLDK